MRQLTSLDAQFLALESKRQVGHVGGLAIVDPSTIPGGGDFDCAHVKQLLRERLPMLPPMRWRLAEVPLGLDYPYWVEDDDFDLDYHVREIGLPRPGNDQQLADQVARIHERPLDRARPLWELYVIQGLDSGHTAVLTKIHHAVVDGLSGAEIMGLLLDLSPEGGELPEPERGPLVAPKTKFNGRVSAHRRFAFSQLPLEDVKTVKNAFGCTVNDVVVSMCAGAVRAWLIDHDELPEEPLVAQIPVYVRTEDQAGTFGNRIMLMAAPLYTQESDPVVRLRRTHEALGEMKQRHKALPAQLLQDANHFIPPAVFSRAAQLTFRLSTGPGRPAWNLVISNVPGPQFPLYLAGARLVANHPVSVITDGMGLNMTVMSYDGHLDFGIVGDREQMPDLWGVVDWLADELTDLLDAAARANA